MSYVEQLLSKNEQLVLVTRQSWVVLVREAIIDLVIAIIIVAVGLVATTIPALGTAGLSLSAGSLVFLLLIIPIVRFILELIAWTNREYIVTNRRVIQIEGTVNKNVIDSSLEMVNDVRLTQSVVGRILNYGDVEILTASELGTNLFQRIGSPIQFKTAMLDQKDKLAFAESPTAAAAPAAEPRPADVPALIASLSALRAENLITEEEFQKKKAELLSRM